MTLAYAKSIKDIYNEKLCTAKEAASKIKSGDRICLSGGTCIPPGFLNELGKRASVLENILLGLGFAMEPFEFMKPENKNAFHIETMFVGPVERQCMKFQMAEYVPVHLDDAPCYIDSANFNVAASVATPPDENGYMCRSLFGSFLHKRHVKKADKVIIEVNKNLPWVNAQDFLIHVSEVDHIIENNSPIPEVPEAQSTQTDKIIAGYISDLIQDGSTIQLGFGGLGNAIGNNLMEKKDLGMHAGVVTTAAMRLMKAGVINGSRKTLFPNKVAAAFCVGTKDLYDYVDNNNDFIFKDIAYIIDPNVMAKNNKLVSINNTLMMDLTGQAASESIGPVQYSGAGSQLNFVRGSKLSEGGKSILALNSTFKDKSGNLKSKIMSCLPAGTAITTPRTEVEYIVTEYGVANLRYKSISKRAKALINIAHPDFRDELKFQAKQNGWL